VRQEDLVDLEAQREILEDLSFQSALYFLSFLSFLSFLLSLIL
jgi:hypothetical protein